MPEDVFKFADSESTQILEGDTGDLERIDDGNSFDSLVGGADFDEMADPERNNPTPEPEETPKPFDGEVIKFVPEPLVTGGPGDFGDSDDGNAGLDSPPVEEDSEPWDPDNLGEWDPQELEEGKRLGDGSKSESDGNPEPGGNFSGDAPPDLFFGSGESTKTLHLYGPDEQESGLFGNGYLGGGHDSAELSPHQPPGVTEAIDVVGSAVDAVQSLFDFDPFG